MDDELAEAVDDAMEPVVSELWDPIRDRVRALRGDLDLPPAPWAVEDLVALVRARAASQP